MKTIFLVVCLLLAGLVACTRTPNNAYPWENNEKVIVIPDKNLAEEDLAAFMAHVGKYLKHDGNDKFLLKAIVLKAPVSGLGIMPVPAMTVVVQNTRFLVEGIVTDGGGLIPGIIDKIEAK